MPARLTYRVALYDALASGATMGVVGLVALAAREPWLFPSLGPTIFLQTVRPQAAASRPWSVLAGHAVGVVAGYAALVACRVPAHAPGLSAGGPAPARVLATALAVLATMAGQRTVRAMHPPAAATTMLIALGSFPETWRSPAAITAGVVLVCLLGEAIRLFRRRLGARIGWPERAGLDWPG